MKTIELSQGKVTQVDDAVYEELSKHKWCVTNGYAARRKPKTKSGQHIYMHRLLCEASEGEHVVHLDGDKLNNQRSNLRAQHYKLRNQAVKTRAASGYRGVVKSQGTYAVTISINGKNQYLGRFPDAENAARAYDAAALKARGEHAMLNFPAEDASLTQAQAHEV